MTFRPRHSVTYSIYSLLIQAEFLFHSVHLSTGNDLVFWKNGRLDWTVGELGFNGAFTQTRRYRALKITSYNQQNI